MTDSGAGSLRFSLVDGATAVREARANSPLKLLCLHRSSGCAWAMASTYGGGILAGDHIRLDVAVEVGTRCFLGTQASTKIYRSPTRQESRQSIEATVEAGAVCVAMPDPVTCFAQARFKQRQLWNLDPSASLVLVDWLTSGRHASGERWAFDRYDSRIDVRVGGKLLVRETLLLDAEDGMIGSASRMGRFDCFATVMVVGPAVRGMGEELVRFVAASPLGESELLFAASAIEGGAICRIAGPTAEAVGGWIRERLAVVAGILGEEPWARKK